MNLDIQYINKLFLILCSSKDKNSHFVGIYNNFTVRLSNHFSLRARSEVFLSNEKVVQRGSAFIHFLNELYNSVHHSYTVPIDFAKHGRNRVVSSGI